MSYSSLDNDGKMKNSNWMYYVSTMLLWVKTYYHYNFMALSNRHYSFFLNTVHTFDTNSRLPFAFTSNQTKIHKNTLVEHHVQTDLNIRPWVKQFDPLENFILINVIVSTCSAQHNVLLTVLLLDPTKILTLTIVL